MTRDEYIKAKENKDIMSDWYGFSPFYLGANYGSSLKLGGEEKFYHCYDEVMFHSPVDFWITKEIDKLTIPEKVELYNILARNKSLNDYKDMNKEVIVIISQKLKCDTSDIYRLGNSKILELINGYNSGIKINLQ